jgi:hypothetical protein
MSRVPPVLHPNYPPSSPAARPDNTAKILLTLFGVFALLLVLLVGGAILGVFLLFTGAKHMHAKAKEVEQAHLERERAIAIVAQQEREVRLQQQVADLAQAIALLEHGDEIDVKRVLLFARGYQFDGANPTADHERLGTLLLKAAQRCEKPFETELVAQAWQRRVEAAQRDFARQEMRRRDAELAERNRQFEAEQRRQRDEQLRADQERRQAELRANPIKPPPVATIDVEQRLRDAKAQQDRSRAAFERQREELMKKHREIQQRVQEAMRK